MRLGYEKGPEILPCLIEKLVDANPSVQHAAVIAIGRHGRAEAIDELIKPKIFHSSNSQIRWAAVAAVGRLGDYRVIDVLLSAVEDPEWIVRTQAVTELMGKIKDIIARGDPRLARILIHMFSLDNEEIINLAIDGLQNLGPSSLNSLYEVIRNPSPTIRANVAKALGMIKSKSSTPHLLDLLQDEEASVRANACEALGRIGDRISVEPLVQMIQDSVEKVQSQAAAAIIGFGKLATVPLLNALSRERDKFAQRALIRCLGRIGDPKSVPALISYLRSSYFIVRQTAVSAISLFGPIVTRHLLAALSFNKSDITKIKQDACDNANPEMQIRAVKALGGLEDHRAVGVLKEAVEKGLPDVQDAATEALLQIGCASWKRCCALKALGEIGDAAIVPEILPSLRDDSDNVRFQAVIVLGKMGGPEAVKHLALMARKDPCDFIRREALRALRAAGKGDPEILNVARRGLKDASREVRVQSARLLGHYLDKKSILPLLKAMADSHWSVRESAETALLNFGREALAPLAESLSSSSRTTRFRAARLLGEIADPEAVPPLERALQRRKERKDVRDVIEASLRRIKTL